MLSSLFLAGMCIDRYIAVKFPMDAQRLCTTSRATKTVVTLSVVISVANIHLFFVVDYMKDKELGRLTHRKTRLVNTVSSPDCFMRYSFFCGYYISMEKR